MNTLQPNAPHTTNPEALHEVRWPAGQALRHGHALTENRHGLVVGGGVTLATRHGRTGGNPCLGRRHSSVPAVDHLGADKAYDVMDFIGDLRRRFGHAAHCHQRTSDEDRQATEDGHPRPNLRHAASRFEPTQPHKRIAEVFGWIKSSAGLAKVRLQQRSKVDAAFTLALAAYNLIRLPKLLSVPT